MDSATIVLNQPASTLWQANMRPIPSQVLTSGRLQVRFYCRTFLGRSAMAGIAGSMLALRPMVLILESGHGTQSYLSLTDMEKHYY